MNLFSTKKDKKAITKALSGLSINLSAGWFGLVVVSPNFWPVKGLKEIGLKEIGLLTFDLLFGTFCLWISYKLERKLL